MADFADDYGDPEEEPPRPLLPLEDRLWRHPSEMDKAAQLPLDPIAVRRRWIQTQPSKASAWTAGLVGALLATGLVVLGTHLASALTGTGTPPTTVTTTAVTSSSPNDIDVSPTIAAFGPSIAHAIRKTATTMATINTQSGSSQHHLLGLVVDAKGLVVVPSRDVVHASSILVTLSNGVEYVGQVIGSDPGIGVALVHVNGVSNVTTAHFASTAATVGSLGLAVSSVKGATAIGTLQTPSPGTTSIANAFSSDINETNTPLGTPLINGNGGVVGMVVASHGHRLIVVPGWSVTSAVQSLIDAQVETTSELGMTTVTAPPSTTRPSGVLVTSVSTGLPAAEAGLQTGQVITAVNGIPVSSKADLDIALREMAPDIEVVFTIYNHEVQGTVIIPAIASSTDS